MLDSALDRPMKGAKGNPGSQREFLNLYIYIYEFTSSFPQVLLHRP